jgi:hypothetical protein
VTYSYSQLSHYLSCPRRYRHRYLDGWQEKDTRAAMLFGRCFEQALGAYFRREDAAVTLYREWAQYQKQPLRYSERDSWDRMLEQGVQLLNRFSQEDRIRVTQPRKNLQVKFVRPLANGNDFVAYVDAIGKLDGRGCLLEWKTTSARYSEQIKMILRAGGHPVAHYRDWLRPGNRRRSFNFCRASRNRHLWSLSQSSSNEAEFAETCAGQAK